LSLPAQDGEGPVTVWLVPTPVGNLADITLRALDVLRGADAVAAEDTRRSRVLLAHYAIQKPLVRLDAHTIRERAPGVLERYPRLAYVTDAGTPGLSDPGAELLQVALDLGGRVEVLPGPTALVPAVVLSGLPAGRFSFHGFLPRGGRDRRERIAEIAASPITTVIYESPHRLHATLQDLAAACGTSRPCAVVREISKMHEETHRGTLATAMERYATGARGEVVIVVGGSPEPEGDGPERLPTRGTARAEHAALAATLAGNGETARVIRERLMQQGLDRNQAYRMALEATREAAVSGGDEG